MQAYQSLIGQAGNVAGQPYQQYTGPLVAGFSPDQLSAFNTIRGAQGMAQPYYNQAANYLQSSAAPITPMTFSSDAMNALMSPYIDQVVNATQDQFSNQNAQQVAQIQGNAATHGAYGGDREAVVQALTAGQQALAQDPVIANLYNSGYGQALGEFNALNQAQIAAQQATGWLQQGAGSLFGNLGNQAQGSAYAGADALMKSGALQQQMEQQQLNIPYQQFLAQQAYPFQTTGWLGNMVMGLGSGMGGTGSTTQPPPSMLGQLAGLGTAGAGIYGLGNQQGWWGGTSDGQQLANQVGADWDPWAPAARGGRIEYAGGGGVPGMPEPMGVGVPDVSLSFVPSGPATGQHSSFINPMQPNTSTKQETGGGGILGTLFSIGKMALPLLAARDGGRIGYDIGGPVPSSIGGSAVAPMVHMGTPLLPLGMMPAPIFGPASQESTAPSMNFAPTFNPAGYPMPMVGVPHGWTPSAPFQIPLSNGALNRAALTPTAASASVAPTGSSSVGVGTVGTMDDPTMQTGSGGGDGGGWRGGNAMHFDAGGGIPDLSVGYVPSINNNQQRRNTIPQPPQVPQVPQPNPMKDIGSLTQSLSKVFKNEDDAKAFGGIVDQRDAYRGFDVGGPVGGMMMSGGAGTPMQQNMTNQYGNMSYGQLQALAHRAGGNPAQDNSIERALQIQRMYPGGQSDPFSLSAPVVQGPQAPSLATPSTVQAANSSISPSLAWRGGAQGYAPGGPVPITPQSGDMNIQAILNEMKATGSPMQVGDAVGASDRMRQELQRRVHPGFYSGGTVRHGYATDGFVPDDTAGMAAGLEPIKGSDIIDADAFWPMVRRPGRNFDTNDPLWLKDPKRPEPVMPAGPPMTSQSYLDADLAGYKPSSARDDLGLAIAPQDADLAGYKPGPAIDDLGLPLPRSTTLPPVRDYSRSMDKGYVPPSGLDRAPPARSLPPGTKFNSRGEPYNLSDSPGQQISASQVTPARIRDMASGDFGAPSQSTLDTMPLQNEPYTAPPAAAAPRVVPQVTSAPGGNGIVPGGAIAAPRVAPISGTGYIPAGSSPKRDNVVNFWTTQGGVSPHGAQGIADRVGAESSFNPAIPGDYKNGTPTSGGLYQHHAERWAALKAYAAKRGVSWDNSDVQNQFALAEATGSDPEVPRQITESQWNEIKNAPDRATAGMLWDKYFERSKNGPGSGNRTYASGISPGYRATVGTGTGEGSGSSGNGTPPPGAGGENGVAKPTTSVPDINLPHRERGLGASPWLSLIAAGLGMMASRSPHPGVAIGEGGLAGVKSLMDQEALNNKRDLQDVQMSAKQQSIGLQAQSLAERTQNHAALLEAKLTAINAQIARGQDSLELRREKMQIEQQLGLARIDAANARSEARSPKLIPGYNTQYGTSGNYVLKPGQEMPDDPSKLPFIPATEKAGSSLTPQQVEEHALKAWTEDQKIVSSNPLHKPRSLQEWRAEYQKMALGSRPRPVWAKQGQEPGIGANGQMIYYDEQNKVWATSDRKPVP